MTRQKNLKEIILFFACCCGMFDYNHSKPNHNITTYNHNFTYITIEKTLIQGQLLFDDARLSYTQTHVLQKRFLNLRDIIHLFSPVISKYLYCCVCRCREMIIAFMVLKINR